MSLFRCDVRIRTARPGGSGVREWTGHHSRIHQQEHTGGGLQQETDSAAGGTVSDEAGSAVHRTGEYRTEGLQPCGTDNRITRGDYQQEDTGPPTAGVRWHGDGRPYTDPDDWTRRSQDETLSCRDRERATGRTGSYDAGRTTFWGGSLRVEKEVRQWSNIGRQSRPGYSTQDGNTTQTAQLSPWIVAYAVCIQLPAGSNLSTDPSTRPGQRANRATGPASIYTSRRNEISERASQRKSTER